MGKISHVFVNFGFVYGKVEFDCDADFDNCIGYISLKINDVEEIFECFHSPKERDAIMYRALCKAANYFGK